MKLMIASDLHGSAYYAGKLLEAYHAEQPGKLLLLGDLLYGAQKGPFRLQGQALHAKVLGFRHPSTGEYLEVDAPLPEYFLRLISQV